MPERKFVYKYRGAWQENRGISQETLETRINLAISQSGPQTLDNFQVYELVPVKLGSFSETRQVVDTKVIINKENK